MPKLADWVKETVTGTPGTGTITLAGAVAGFCRFQDNFATGDKVYYSIEDGNNREEGYGTLTTGSPWTLTRTTVLRTISAGTFNNSSPSALSLTSTAIVGIAAAADIIGLVVGSAYASTSSLITCNTVLPCDNTIPQNTEGTEVITLAYTPKFADSILRIRAVLSGAQAAQYVTAAALFVDNTANALVAQASYSGASGHEVYELYHEEVSGNTTSRTYKVRCGPNTAGTVYVNGNQAGTQYFNGVEKSGISITEIRQ